MAQFPGGIQNCLKQVGELLRDKFVAFEVGDEFAIPGNNHGMQRMNEESFVRNEVHSEPVTYALDIGGRSGEETPVSGSAFRRRWPLCTTPERLPFPCQTISGTCGWSSRPRRGLPLEDYALSGPLEKMVSAVGIEPTTY